MLHNLLRNILTPCLLVVCFMWTNTLSATLATRADKYLRHVGDGLENSYAQPALFIWCCGGIAGLSLLDGQIKERFAGRLLPERVSRSADWYGKGVDWALGNSYILGEYMTGDRSRNQVLDRLQVFNEAWAVNLAVTHLLKTTVKRERPGKQNNHSFPSGHSSGAFCVAVTLQELYGNRAGVPAYTIAAITGIQRIHDNRHWFSDVLAGALLGTCIGHGFAELVKDDTKNTKSKSFKLSVSLSF